MDETTLSSIEADRTNIREFLLRLWGLEKLGALNKILSEKCGYGAKATWTSIWLARLRIKKSVLDKMKLAIEQELEGKDGKDSLHATYRALNWESMLQKATTRHKKVKLQMDPQRKQIQDFLLALWGLNKLGDLQDLLSEKCGYKAGTWQMVLSGHFTISELKFIRLIEVIEETLRAKDVDDKLHIKYGSLDWHSIRGTMNSKSVSNASQSEAVKNKPQCFILQCPPGYKVLLEQGPTGTTITIIPSG